MSLKHKLKENMGENDGNTASLTSTEKELVSRVKAGHFQYFQDLFAETTSPYSDYFGVDPYRVWRAAKG